MQPSWTLPLASARAPERAKRVAIEIADAGLAATLIAEIALMPGLALARRDEPADLVMTDRPDRAFGAPVLAIGEGTRLPLGDLRPSMVEGRDPRLLTAAALLAANGYRIEREPHSDSLAAVAGAGALTARERQVAELLVEGASNKVIARRLDISVHTAKFHVAAVLQKLHARNRSDAVAIALRDGLVAL